MEQGATIPGMLTVGPWLSLMTLLGFQLVTATATLTAAAST